MTHKILLVSIFAFCCSGLFAADSPSPFLGKWRLNPSKSKYTDSPAPKAMDVAIKEDGGRYVMLFAVVQQDDTTYSLEISFPDGGGACKVVGPPDSPLPDITVDAASPSHWIFKFLDHGKLEEIRDVEISADGKLWQGKFTAADGHLLANEVADKQ